MVLKEVGNVWSVSFEGAEDGPAEGGKSGDDLSRDVPFFGLPIGWVLYL